MVYHTAPHNDKDEANRVLKCANPTKANISKEMFKALRESRKGKSWVMLKTDKEMAMI